MFLTIDVCSHRAQATLGVLYAQPPLTHDANVATDGIMALGVVEPVAEGKKVEESFEGLPSPGDSANASVDVALNDVNAAMSVETVGVGRVAGETILAAPPVLVPIGEQQQQGEGDDLPGVTELSAVSPGCLIEKACAAGFGVCGFGAVYALWEYAGSQLKSQLHSRCRMRARTHQLFAKHAVTVDHHT